MSMFKVTVQYLDGHEAVHEAGRLVTESAQWKLQQQAGSDDRIVLIPMAAVRHVRMERAGGGKTTNTVITDNKSGGGSALAAPVSYTWTTS